MLDIGFMEILVIGAIALIVVGPKELPGLLRTVGQFAGKARGMAREFQRTMEDAAREADLGDVADVVKGKKNNLPFGNQVVDSLKEFQNTVKSEVTDAARAAESSVNEAKAAAEGAVEAAKPETPVNAPADAPKVAPKVAQAKVEPAKSAPTAADAPQPKPAESAPEAKSA